jgi:MinD-like ATPase involved in chromosome partitioning or flagellar assembly
VVTAGGRGGTGRTTLALEVATTLALAADGAGWRVLLVDGDPFQPDLDVKLGAAGLARALAPNASIDQVLQRLPELADKRVSLESLLWLDRESGVRALFAARCFSEVGREHLDYLYTNMVAPAFDAIVVDAGQLLEMPSGRMQEPAAFWLGLASTILVPLRPTASHVRSAVDGISVLERMGIEVQICRLIMGVEKSEVAAAAHWQGQLGEFVVLRWPWIADVARKSAPLHRSLSMTDQRFAANIAALLPELTASRSVER